MTAQPSATIEDARRLIVDALVEIAPDLEGAEVAAEAGLREDLGLDSMDFINLMAVLSGQLGADIPECDYARLETLGSSAACLREQAGAR